MEEKLIRSVVITVAVLALLDWLGVGGSDFLGSLKRLGSDANGRPVTWLAVGLVGYTVYRVIKHITES